MKKIYRVSELQKKSDKELFLLGVQNNDNAEQVAKAIHAKMTDAKRTDVTPFLQEMARTTMTKKESNNPNHILHKGYQSWKDSEYEPYYRFVNTRQARIRQLFPKKKTSNKNTNKKTATESKEQAVGKERMKAAAQRKRAESWSNKAKTAQTALKTVQESSKKQLKTIASLEKKIKELEKENNRLKRELSGHDKVYHTLLNRVKKANTIEEYQAII